MERFRISKGKSQLTVTKRKSNGQNIVDSDTSFLKCLISQNCFGSFEKSFIACSSFIKTCIFEGRE